LELHTVHSKHSKWHRVSDAQVEKELAEERVAAEAEAKRAQEAIQAKQQELQQIEQQRQHEVHNHLPCLTPSPLTLVLLGQHSMSGP